MPELPEVETIVRDLRKKVLNRAFIDVWTDNPKIVKRPTGFKQFKSGIKNKKIIKIWRRAKNIIFGLSEGYSLLIHQKLTGHLLIGNWKLKIENWEPLNEGLLKERVNSYIHLMFWLSGDLMLALSDLRKFAKVELWKTKELEKEFEKLGPEPLGRDFTFDKFKKTLKDRKGKALLRHRLRTGKAPLRLQLRRGKIKQVLMNQEIIAGIGNIYSDEILWRAKIHPFKDVSKLTESELKLIFQNIKKVLKLAIKLRGESFSDFRDLSGRKGFFDRARKVYQREGEKCFRCGATIKRVKISGRSAHYCPRCQKY